MNNPSSTRAPMFTSVTVAPERDTMTYAERLKKWIKTQPPEERAQWIEYVHSTKQKGISKYHSQINSN